MAGRKKPKKLPDNFDPRDMDVKKQLHDLADDKNIAHRRKNGSDVLACGAKKRGKREGLCTQLAGWGTDHPGYGRCKNHGGCNTGPKTKEAKARISQNARKHGFYSQVLSKDERETYEDLLDNKTVNLEDEIFMLKAKIKTYLKRHHLREQAAGYKHTKVFFKEGETAAYYHAGSIEDRALNRALETLRRLVDSYAKLTGQDSDDIINQINVELKQASQDAAKESWGGPSQSREEGGSDNGKEGL